jgi:hypothetical protein
MSNRTVACVLNTRPWTVRGRAVSYGPEHVLWLKEQVERHYAGTDLDFVVLSDVVIPGVNRIALRHDWPGWWSKMELFRCFDSALYLDLDTVIIGDITEIVQADVEKLHALRDFSGKDSSRMGSGILKWTGDYTRLYSDFRRHAARHMQRYTRSTHWGDQGFIRDQVPDHGYLQDLYPDRIISYKADVLDKPHPHPMPSIVCFHGEPKPWAQSVQLKGVPPLASYIAALKGGAS